MQSSAAKHRAISLATKLGAVITSSRGKTVVAALLVSGSASYVYIQLQMQQAAVRRKRLRSAVRSASTNPLLITAASITVSHHSGIQLKCNSIDLNYQISKSPKANLSLR